MAVARLHAEISISGSQVQIRDLGARNGVLVNGKRIIEQELGPDDEITLGNVVLRLRQGDDSVPSSDIEKAKASGDARDLIRDAPMYGQIPARTIV